ncbi:AraC family transcriptional regulator [Chitinophaga sancti]|uniref:helix-turn-helix transcriptional regulator n=1 Tax=Chitinophaga sancti TaxID=1004 RepID=UPI002A761020|nr:AraC family transcriptional regulator [Chitinophaga sancti]WPQ61826.1 AraC family transcriptional regulator [Chitinophaga sancti]
MYHDLLEQLKTFEYKKVEGQFDARTGVLQIYRGMDFIISDSEMITVADTPSWEHYNSPGWAEFTFVVKGSILQTQVGLYENRVLPQGSHSFLFNPGTLEVNQLMGKGDFRIISILMPVEKAIALFNEYLPEFPHVAQQLISGKALFHESPDLRFSDRIANILNHLWESPKQPQLQKLYFESMVNELFCLQWESMLHEPRVHTGIKLRVSDIEKLHYAAGILARSYQEPPSLEELANKAQLNEYKLKAGFKQLYGTSVLNYALNLRLEQAQQMIKDTDKTISEIAYELGYAHSQHFQRAFKKKFGITPNSFRKLFNT